MTSHRSITVGESTEQLLLALQSVEDARTRFFAAFEAVGGERYAGEMCDLSATPFDALRDLIEGEITEKMRAWACSSDPEKVL